MATKKKLVRFLKSPTGKYGLAYNEGDEVKVPVKIADSMIEDKTAIEITAAAANKENDPPDGGEAGKENDPPDGK